MEIYNEKIRDLLSKHESKEEYKIHHHANGDTTVPHMTIISVGSANEVSRLLQQAIQNRFGSMSGSLESTYHCILFIKQRK